MPLFKDTSNGTLADRIRKASEQRSPAATAERKRLPRESVYAIGTLSTESSKMQVVIKNVSALGARIEFTSNVPLRGAMTLVSPRLGIDTRVRVAWQKGSSAGLIFVKA